VTNAVWLVARASADQDDPRRDLALSSDPLRLRTAADGVVYLSAAQVFELVESEEFAVF
jgi:hypothetical protein